MKKKKLIEIYDNAKRCADRHHSSSFIKCIKKQLETDIGNDRDILLAYKIESTKGADYSPIVFSIAVITFIMTVLSIIVGNDNSLIISSILMIYIVFLTIAAISAIRRIDKYKTILMILEEIEKNMK